MARASSATKLRVRGPVAHRLDAAADQALAEPIARHRGPPSHIAAAPPEPQLYLHWWSSNDENNFTVETDVALGPVTIELYDHHRTALTTTTKGVKPLPRGCRQEQRDPSYPMY